MPPQDLKVGHVLGLLGGYVLSPADYLELLRSGTRYNPGYAEHLGWAEKCLWQLYVHSFMTPFNVPPEVKQGRGGEGRGWFGEGGRRACATAAAPLCHRPCPPVALPAPAPLCHSPCAPVPPPLHPCATATAPLPLCPSPCPPHLPPCPPSVQHAAPPD